METWILVALALVKIAAWVVPTLILAGVVNHFYGAEVDRLLGAPEHDAEATDNVTYLPVRTDDHGRQAG